MADVTIREPLPEEVEALAHLWHQGWQDAHADILPEALARHRTLASFVDRMRAHLADTRTVGPPGKPLGFAMITQDELYQLYIAPDARGTGISSLLIVDAEARVAAQGYRTIWLACAIGNHRAARFYEKSGWANTGVITSILDTPDGSFALDVWRYEKQLKL